MGSSLQCAVTISLPSPPGDGKLRDVLARYDPAELADMFVVSQVRVGGATPEEGSSPEPEWIETAAVGGREDGATVSVTPPEAHKCPRCWRYVATEEDGLCGRCEGVVGEGVD